ncbi:acyltransferase [Nostoc commune]|uniref:acyltransferase n=1 Tax=Nostoc commune TaxID=1178 RepID=UPI0018C4B791|nr:acyltransferase [Nostoc commune]MBG1261430.1 hypothetical protein [Nostoc commune BAE]
MKNTIRLTQFDANLVHVPPIAIFFEFRKQIDIDQLYVSILKTLKLFPTFSARFLDDGEYFLCYVPDYFGFTVLESSDSQLSSSLHRNTTFESLKILGIPATIEQPVLNIFLVQKANGSQLTINLSHGVGDGASLKFFTIQLFCFLKKQDSHIIPSSQRNFNLEEFNKTIDSQLTYKNHQVVLRDCSFRSGYFNEFILSFDKIKNIYQQMCLDIYIEKGSLKLHDALASFLLKSLISSLNYNNEEINVLIPIDIRNLFYPLDSYYIGNGFIEAFYSWKYEELLSLDKVKLAMQIRQTLRKFSDPMFINNKVKMAETGLNLQEFNKEEVYSFAYDEFIGLTSLGRLDSILSLSGSEKIGIIADNSYSIATFRINRDYIINIASPQKLPTHDLL